MSVLINMEMPTSCGECKAFVCYRQWAGDIGDCFCGITKSDAKAGARNDDCPLVPVPPHGRLGDLDALKAKAIERSEKCGVCVNVLDNVITAYDIETAPTIISEDKED